MRRKAPLLLRYVVLLACVAGSGGLLLYTSQSVQREEGRLKRLENSIVREAQMIEVLEAEWARLNSPYHLEGLSEHYLDLVPPDTRAVLPHVPQLPDARPISVLREDNGEAQDLKVDVSGQEVLEEPSRESSIAKPARKPAVPLRKSLGQNRPAREKSVQSDDLGDVFKRLRGGES